MSRWAKILNMCDDVLEKAAVKAGPSSSLAVDLNPDLVPQVIVVMSFTALLFENTITRSIYNSADVSSLVLALYLLSCFNLQL